jgi:hypothetical protein
MVSIHKAAEFLGVSAQPLRRFDGVKQAVAEAQIC